MADQPEITVNGASLESEGDASPQIWPGWTDELPKLDNDNIVDINRHAVRFQNDNPSKFFPTKLLDAIFNEEVLTRELEKYPENLADGRGLARQILNLQGDGRRYLGIFTILKTMRAVKYIRGFIEHGVCDEDLPLVSTEEGEFPLFRRDDLERPLPNILKFDHRQIFLSRQYQVIVPFFDHKECPRNFEYEQVLPYYKLKLPSGSECYGGYGAVSKVVLHPLCYNFDLQLRHIQSPDEEGYFALKKLMSHTPAEFENEVAMLKRFNGRVHEHLVTLLAAWNHQGEHFLLFPWATGDLLFYLESYNPRPNNEDPKTIRWVAYQAWKLVQALDCIHNPAPSENLGDPERFGRHGDLKPENILWFRGGSDLSGIPNHLTLGKLVISDMGLSEQHRFVSRSNIPNSKVRSTPKFRPPECDYEGGEINRAYDIWTLGCIFLDLATWLLGGYELIQKMDEGRWTPSIRGTYTEEYFEWVRVVDSGAHNGGKAFSTVKLKQAVHECFADLRRLPRCTGFIWDFLDIIQRDMLVVERDDRIRVTPLQEKLRQLYDRTNEDSYCVGVSHDRPGYSPPMPVLVPREFGREVQQAVQSRQVVLELRPVPREDFVPTETR
ncbi:kinase-like domain-containing protein [Xylaria palmicola]|nr:kinase-like domain-containing protein [Xylaria palmicola]